MLWHQNEKSSNSNCTNRTHKAHLYQNKTQESSNSSESSKIGDYYDIREEFISAQWNQTEALTSQSSQSIAPESYQ